MPLDFSALASRLLGQARALLPLWLPAGKWRGHEYVLGNLRGEPGDSLSINANTGQWKDFASGEKGGDLISLYAAIHGISQGDAARKLDDGSIAMQSASAPKRQEKPRRRVITPVPDGVKPHDCTHFKYRAPVKVWSYRGIDGKLLGHVARYEPAGEKKQIIPWTYGEREGHSPRWEMGQWLEPRPLYGLDLLWQASLDTHVIVVEGEKACDAARLIAPQYVVTTWPGGSQAHQKASFDILRGRNILLWPDADEAGIKAMWEIGHRLIKLTRNVKIIIPDGVSDGWDAADALAEGWGWQKLKAWALPRVQQITDGGNNGTSGNAGKAGEGRDNVDHRPHERTAQGHDDRGQSEQAEPVRDVHDRGEVEDARHMGAAERDYYAGASSSSVQPGERDDGEPQGTGASDRVSGASLDPRSQAMDRGGRGETRGAREGSQHPARSPQDQNAKDNAPPLGQVASWLAWSLDRNGNGIPIVNLNNAVIVLQNDPKLAGIIWYDEFLNRMMTGAPFPREWTDADDINLALYLQRNTGISKLGKETASQAAVVVGMRDTRNCVRDWMNTLVWDGTARIDHFFEDNFGAKDTEFCRAVSANFWISMAARVYQPGCKVDNMVVLEGGQGLRKSTALSIIGGDWFAEQHESATNSKAFAEVLQGKLLIEISEMDAFSRSEVNTIKKVVSCQSDRYRPAYGRHARDQRRQCVMVGTVNKDDWNRDETGARRFWPIACSGMVNVDNIRDNREQYFAEAIARFKGGATWWEVPAAEARAEQRKRYQADPWLEIVSGYVMGRSYVFTLDILTDPLNLEVGRITKGEEMRVAACLRALGWRNVGNVRDGGKVRKKWEPDPERVDEVATLRTSRPVELPFAWSKDHE